MCDCGVANVMWSSDLFDLLLTWPSYYS